MAMAKMAGEGEGCQKYSVHIACCALQPIPNITKGIFKMFMVSFMPINFALGVNDLFLDNPSFRLLYYLKLVEEHLY